MCEHLYSKESHWRAGSKIVPTIFLTKRPGNRRTGDKEQCYAKYDKTEFLEHLASRVNCIYHKLASKFEALESCLNKAYIWGQSNPVLQTEQYVLCSHVQVHLQRS